MDKSKLVDDEIELKKKEAYYAGNIGTYETFFSCVLDYMNRYVRMKDRLT